MARIPSDVIERIRDAADIFEVVGQYVDLKKRGRNYFGLCPFHAEKTPSFSVAPDKGIYHCFGCGAGGSAINFLMEYEKIAFPEAVQRLGRRYGIPVEFSRAEGSQEFFNALYELHQQAAELYARTLFSPRGQEAREYLLKRGLEEEILKQFRVGFAPDHREFLLKVARKGSFSTEVLEKSGLFSKSAGGFFDRFRARIMFPITNPSGKVIAFGGRIFGRDDPAKYLNSPETPLYHKSDVFFGLAASRDSIRQARAAILVEGYTDFLQLYQAGLPNVVAVSGTALTERHVSQIRKFTAKVFLAYDGDAAGVRASLRAGYLLLRGGVEALVVALPEDLDPDDWVRQEGVEGVQRGLDSACPVLKFHLATAQALDLPAAERSQLVRDIIGEIATISDAIIRNDLVQTMAEELRLDEGDILRQFKRQLQRSRPVRQREGPEEPSSEEPALFTSVLEKAQVEIIRVLAGDHREALELAREKLNPDLFTQPLLKKLAQRILKAESVDPAALLEEFETRSERERVASILFEEHILTDPVQIVEECITTLRLQPLKEQIKAARIRIREHEAAGQDATPILLEVARLQAELQSLSSGKSSPEV